MSDSAKARAVADAQLVAYNAQDVEAYLALFHADAVLINLPDQHVVAEGLEAIREMYTARFKTPGLRSDVLERTEVGNIAVDREVIHTDGNAPVDILAMYEVIDSKIKRVFFVRGGTL